jgi:hypothetical protein
MREAVQLRGDSREDGAVNGFRRRGGESGGNSGCGPNPLQGQLAPALPFSGGRGGQGADQLAVFQNTDLMGGRFISTERGVYVLKGPLSPATASRSSATGSR